MGFYENPLIGWFVKKKLKRIFIVFVIITILYLIYFKEAVPKISYGCNYPNCESTHCTGEKCFASGCYGDNCKGGDCYGESCEAGGCQGTGCRAGDCYGKDCVPGKCSDPECSSKDETCKPFCKDGQAFNLPIGKFYKYTSKLPNNSIINPNYCNNKKSTYILKDNKHIWNYSVDKVNFHFAKSKTPEEIAYPDDLQDGKRFVLAGDDQFLNTYPDIYKKYNCTWCTKMKDNEICASYKPYLNPVTNEFTWNPDDWRCATLDDEGKDDGCRKSNDDMNLINVNSVQYQINIINSSSSSIAKKNYEIDNIIGEILTYQCKGKKTCTQHINLRNNLTDFKGQIVPCQRRAYIMQKFNIGGINQYEPTLFQIFNKDSYEQQVFIYNYNNQKKTFRDHHIWIYSYSQDNNQFYTCHWCKKILVINNQALPKRMDGQVDTCYYSYDFNHYLYQKVDDNKNVFLKCLKCGKEVYIK